MKALSGYAEWFWLMAKNIKPEENRPWSLFRYIKREELPIRVYLHASKTKTPPDELAFIRSHLGSDQLIEFNKVDWERYRGKIIAEITIRGEISGPEISTLSLWAFGPFCFLVNDGELYDNPIPYRGQLGFFPVILPSVR
ncbi:MAG: hypothetical protein PHI12_06440 [Dehalococcoidales bacterium]|nr:hypothetical protein [Dehalococcoidales bacterium]